MFQRGLLLGPGRALHGLLFPGAAVVVIQLHEIGIDDPQPGQRVRDILFIGQGDVEVIVRGGALVGPAVRQLHVAAPAIPAGRAAG